MINLTPQNYFRLVSDTRVQPTPFPHIHSTQIIAHWIYRLAFQEMKKKKEKKEKSIFKN